MPSKVDELVLRLEACLFASGKPMSVKEITEALGAPDHRPVQSALKQLSKIYEGRQTALEVRRVGDRYALQVREAYVAGVHGVTPLDMPPRTLKALTLIAYHQPVLQSLLVKMLGEATYEEVGRLQGMNLIHAEPKGSTLELRTTKTFAEYFGISSTKPEEIRKFLEEKLGVSAAPTVASIPAAPEPGTSPGPDATADGSEPMPEAAPPDPASPAES